MHRTQVYKMKTVFNYYIAILSDVQPFEKFSNFQSLKTSILLSGNYCCYTSLPLKMTSKYKCQPPAETHSMIVVHSRRLGSFLKVLRFSTIPNTRPLAPISYMRPISSIFHRSACITFLMAGRSKSGNYAYIALVLTPLTRTASIRRV